MVYSVAPEFAGEDRSLGWVFPRCCWLHCSLAFPCSLVPLVVIGLAVVQKSAKIGARRKTAALNISVLNKERSQESIFNELRFFEDNTGQRKFFQSMAETNSGSKYAVGLYLYFS